MKRFAIALTICALPAHADQHLAELHAGILACEDHSCVGDAAQLCMESAEDGYTTVGMIDCTAQETAVWDGLLNEAYQQAMALMRELDTADESRMPEYAVRAGQLRSAQRAWITFRDTNCAMEYGIWGAGSMRGLAGAACHLEMTAARTFTLRSYPEMFP